MSNIRIDIASEFKDKGFKQAEKATSGLNSQLKTLGKTLAATFGAREIYQFSKASVKAFSDDQQAAIRLTKSLENLGLAFENARVSNFISELESASGVLDDSLRPAMQSLLMTTGSVTKSQELLNLALEMSRSSGIDVANVSKDLAKAYLGQTKGLSKYNTGLTQTELKTKSFAELQELLNKQFAGQNAAYLETYAGKVGILNVAYANMQETIGEGLVDAFQILSGDSGINGGTKAMDIFAESIANVTRGVATLITGFSDLRSYGSTVFDFFKNFATEGNVLKAIAEMGKKNKPLFFPTAGDPAAQERARAKAEAAAAKRAKELAALNRKAALAAAKAEKERLKREREAQALKRAGTVFDLENIQLVAAMQAKLTDNERLRVTALLALNTGNAEAAEKLSTAVLAANAAALANLGIMMQSGDSISDVVKKIIEAQGKAAILGMNIGNIPKAPNPFEAWPSIIAGLLSQIGQLNGAINGLGKGGTGGAGGGAGTGGGGGSTVGKGGNSGVGGQTVTVPSAITPPAGVSPGTSLGGGFTMGANQYPNSSYFAGIAATSPYIPSSYFATAPDVRTTPPTVVVNIAGNVSTEQDLIEAVTQGIYEIQKRGQSITLNAVAL